MTVSHPSFCYYTI